LAARGARDLRQDVPAARDLMPREALDGPCVQLSHRVGRLVAEDDGYADVLAEERVLEGECAHVGGRREALDDVVDVCGIHLQSALVDLLALASAKVQPT